MVTWEKTPNKIEKLKEGIIKLREIENRRNKNIKGERRM